MGKPTRDRLEQLPHEGPQNRSLTLLVGFSAGATRITKSPPSQKYLAYVCKQDISLMTAFLKNRGAFYNPGTTGMTPLFGSSPQGSQEVIKAKRGGLAGQDQVPDLGLECPNPPFMKITRGSIVKPPT
ncbi:hypothetical protein CDAR_600621 [Caerostris darwini]|uniref:Uncharacterized protein n=1 Tax=Caerostris darwini TaxID=1538125 RepID=A0AAV4TT24_9ARAC|nr:hypothetical protein CDAR_600621 [Caerostris darwini]